MACNLTRAPCVHVSGTVRATREHATVLLRRTPCGWSQRVVDETTNKRHAFLNVDYVSHETRKQLRDWLQCDFEAYEIADGADA